MKDGIRAIVWLGMGLAKGFSGCELSVSVSS